ncbi:MAG: DUF4258 domain-containing protein [Chitinophagales bacterium]
MATPTKKQNIVLSTALLLLLWLLQHFGIIDVSEYFPQDNKNPSIEEQTNTEKENKEPSLPSAHSKTTEELDKAPKALPKTKTPPPNTVNSDLLSERLVYTRHARCRMDCRYISEAEVAYILRNGKINPQKSKPHDAPCPTYALEGITPDDRQEVRIVFAACDDATKVITTIDLGKEYQCHCE